MRFVFACCKPMTSLFFVSRRGTALRLIVVEGCQRGAAMGCFVSLWLTSTAISQEAAPPVQTNQTIRMATSPKLMPDGTRLALTWDGDIWSAEATGGGARRLTSHPAREGSPAFSTDASGSLSPASAPGCRKCG